MNVTGVRSFNQFSNGQHTQTAKHAPRAPWQSSITDWIVGNPLSVMISGFLMGVLLGVYVRR